MTQEDRMPRTGSALRAHRTVLGANDTLMSRSIAVVLALLIGAVIGLRMRRQHVRQLQG